MFEAKDIPLLLNTIKVLDKKCKDWQWRYEKACHDYEPRIQELEKQLRVATQTLKRIATFNETGNTALAQRALERIEAKHGL